MGWLVFCGQTVLQKMAIVVNKERKYQDIPLLQDYSVDPGDKFWEKFPSKGIPVSPAKKFNHNELEKLLTERGGMLTECERLRGDKAVRYILEGGGPCFPEEGIACSKL